MKKLILAMALTGAMGSGATAIAQEVPKRPNTTTGAETKVTTWHAMRASKLIGTKLINSNKESVGTIKDVVVDPSRGRILYVAVAYGGFLGLGDKWFAVPLEAIKIVHDPNAVDKTQFHLDVTKEQMQGARGFDENNWPDFADPDFVGDLYRRYRVESRWNHNLDHEGRGVDVQVDRDGVKVETNRNKNQ